MSTLNDNDLFVYQDATTGETGAVENSNRSSLNDEDLFVVYRPSEDKNYSIKASDVGGGGGGDPVLIKKPEVLTPPDGAGVGGDVNYNAETSAITDASGPIQSVHDLGANFIEVGNSINEVGQKSYMWDMNFGTKYGFRNMSGSEPGQWLWIRFSQNYDGTTSVFRTGVAVEFTIHIDCNTPVHVELAYEDGTKEYSQVHSGNGFITFVTKPKPLGSSKIVPISGPVSSCTIECGGLYINGDTNDELVNTQKFILEGPAKMVLADSKIYNSVNGNEIADKTIDQVFTAGTVVDGKGGTTRAATPAFSTTLYIGNSPSTGSGYQRTINTGIDNTQKSMIWFKNRDVSSDFGLFDTERTPPDHRWLVSNKNQAETDSAEVLKDRTTTGFTVVHPTTGSGTGLLNPNNNEKMVAWNFRAAPSFFDIVTYETDTSGAQKVPHKLGVVPGMMIRKNIDAIQDWYVWHKDLDHTGGASQQKLLILNSQNDQSSGSAWYDTPTDTEFWTRSSTAGTAVTYLFADTPGLIKCDKYLGIGSGSDNLIDCGFKPEWVMLKCKDTPSNWYILDRKRGTGSLQPHYEGQEFQSAAFYFTDNGFAVKSNNSDTNEAGKEYVYVAIVENAMADVFPPSGVLAADADPSEPSILLDNVTGTFTEGMTVVSRTEFTETAPDANSIVFTSDEPALVSGVIADWGNAEWELSTDSAFTSPQTSSVQLTASGVQQGPTNFTLEEGTDYWVRTKYNSGNPAAESAYSNANHFKTKAGAWVSYDPPSNEQWRSVCYGNGFYVAVASTGDERVAVSTTGEANSWTLVNAPKQGWLDITFGAGKFVAVSKDATMIASDPREVGGSNGWVSSSTPNNNNWYRVVYGNNGWYMIASGGDGNDQAYSTDGKNWTAYNNPENPFKNITNQTGARYLRVRGAGSQKGVFQASNPNAENQWSRIGPVPSFECQGVADNGSNAMVVVGFGDKILWSTNYSSATEEQVMPEANAFYNVAYGDGKFVAISSDGLNRIAWCNETDLSTWYAQAAPDDMSSQSLTYCNDRFMSVSSSAFVWSSTVSDTATTFDSSLYFNANNRTVCDGDKLISQYGTTDVEKLGIYSVDDINRSITTYNSY